jgi:hypothetical protein
MRFLVAGGVALLTACASTAPAHVSTPASPPPPSASAPASPPPERLATDTPRSPEGDSRLALVDVRAAAADAAVAAAWAAYRPDVRWPLKVTTSGPDRDGWTDRREYTYLLLHSRLHARVVRGPQGPPARRGASGPAPGLGDLGDEGASRHRKCHLGLDSDCHRNAEPKEKPPRLLRNRGGQKVGATGFEPATTCTPIAPAP